MAQGRRHYWRSNREWIVGAISTGLFLIVVGAIFIKTPTLSDKIVTFFGDFNSTVQVSNSTIYLPAPKSPGLHIEVYSAVMLFSLLWGSRRLESWFSGLLCIRQQRRRPKPLGISSTG